MNKHWFLVNLFLCCMALFTTCVFADAQYGSSSGNVVFDPGNDGINTMVLDQTGNLGLGKTLPMSPLDVSGNVAFGASLSSNGMHVKGKKSFVNQLLTGNASLGGNTQVFVDTRGGDVELTVPNPANQLGVEYKIHKTRAENSLTLTASSGNFEYASSTLSFSSNYQAYINILSNGSTWLLMDNVLR
jgi:hypothetical protein